MFKHLHLNSTFVGPKIKKMYMSIFYPLGVVGRGSETQLDGVKI